ncbi:MAG: DUF535 family protein [Psittacicella sp.]
MFLKESIKRSKQCYPDHEASKYTNSLVRRRVQFILKTFFVRKYFKDFLNIINPEIFDLAVKDQPRFLERLFRPYLFKDNSDKAKVLKNLKNHFDILLASFGLENSLEIYKKDFVFFEFKTETHKYTLELAPAVYDKEGELCFVLKQDNKVDFYVLSMLLINPENPSLFIGGLQGPLPKEENTVEIKFLTKLMYGLRPKEFMLILAKLLAKDLNLSLIEAVSNETHIYKSKRYLRKNKSTSDYNSLWESQGGVLNIKGNFEIKDFSVKRDLEFIASKKRSMYRKRYEMIDNIENSLIDCLNK